MILTKFSFIECKYQYMFQGCVNLSITKTLYLEEETTHNSPCQSVRPQSYLLGCHLRQPTIVYKGMFYLISNSCSAITLRASPA